MAVRGMFDDMNVAPIAGNPEMILIRPCRLFVSTRKVRFDPADSTDQRNTFLSYEVNRCAMVTSRIWFTAAQKAELRERWKNGQSAAAISRALERKNKTGVERIVVLHGGIVPAPRRRALAALRLEEREEVSRGVAVGRCATKDQRGGKSAIGLA
jgi:hypothetical protein